jgi:predicted  nucleic acid-binding Zn-ribbon protein
MNKAKQLYELQEVDFEIEQKSEALVRVGNQLGKDDELVDARATLDSARKNLSEREQQQKAAEWDVSELEAKIAHEEKKLYDGSIKNPRELMNLQHEIDLLKEKRNAQEERLLALMIEVDAAQQDVSSKSNEVDAMEKDWRQGQVSLESEQAELQTALADLGTKRESLVSLTDPESVKAYEEVRLLKGGHAVAKVVQARCQGCRISLPMSDQQQARSGHQLVKCSNCGRILCMD